MYSFVNHIIVSIALIVTTCISKAQTINNEFFNMSVYRYKNNSLKVSKLLAHEHIKNHFIKRCDEYRVELQRTTNLIQVYYKVFFISIDTHNTIIRNNTIIFKAIIGKGIAPVKTDWSRIYNHSLSIDYRFYLKNNMSIYLSLSLQIS